MVRTQNTKEILQRVRSLGARHSTWQVFDDFVSMAAISISNAVDWLHKEEREKQYLDIAGRYDREELELFPQMFAYLVEELERHAEAPQDVLGPLFHELELHNKWKGQFFTPQHLCDFMGMVSFDEHDPDIEKKGYITVCEPCCGGGAMVLGLAKAMVNNKHDFHTQMVVTATDIDMKCVFMTYLQLSLYGIPAVVIHGDSLLLKEWSRWYTPVYMLDGWIWRQTCGNLDKRYAEDEIIKRAIKPTYDYIRDLKAGERARGESGKGANETGPGDSGEKFDVELTEGKNGQIKIEL